MTLLIGFEAIEKARLNGRSCAHFGKKHGNGRLPNVSRGRHQVPQRYHHRHFGFSQITGCVALAEYLYGSETSFVQIMNDKAKELA